MVPRLGGDRSVMGQMLHRPIGPAVLVAFAACLFGGNAQASERLADVDVSGVSLRVDAHGEALVTYRTGAGAVRHVLAWGAENAVAPDPEVAQEAFHLDYSG